MRRSSCDRACCIHLYPKCLDTYLRVNILSSWTWKYYILSVQQYLPYEVGPVLNRTGRRNVTWFVTSSTAVDEVEPPRICDNRDAFGAIHGVVWAKKTRILKEICALNRPFGAKLSRHIQGHLNVTIIASNCVSLLDTSLSNYGRYILYN